MTVSLSRSTRLEKHPGSRGAQNSEFPGVTPGVQLDKSWALSKGIGIGSLALTRWNDGDLLGMEASHCMGARQ